MKFHSLQSPPLEFVDCLSHGLEPGSALYCCRSSCRPIDSPAAPLSPVMAFLEDHWSPSSLSDADSTVAGSDPTHPRGVGARFTSRPPKDG